MALLEHQNGWVRINAAKAIGWLGDERAIKPVAKILAEAKAEADHGYSGTFKDEEYDDPAPRWREGLNDAGSSSAKRTPRISCDDSRRPIWPDHRFYSF